MILTIFLTLQGAIILVQADIGPFELTTDPTPIRFDEPFTIYGSGFTPGASYLIEADSTGDYLELGTGVADSQGDLVIENAMVPLALRFHILIDGPNNMMVFVYEVAPPYQHYYTSLKIAVPYLEMEPTGIHIGESFTVNGYHLTPGEEYEITARQEFAQQDPFVQSYGYVTSDQNGYFILEDLSIDGSLRNILENEYFRIHAVGDISVYMFLYQLDPIIVINPSPINYETTFSYQASGIYADTLFRVQVETDTGAEPIFFGTSNSQGELEVTGQIPKSADLYFEGDDVVFSLVEPSTGETLEIRVPFVTMEMTVPYGYLGIPIDLVGTGFIPNIQYEFIFSKRADTQQVSMGTATCDAQGILDFEYVFQSANRLDRDEDPYIYYLRVIDLDTGKKVFTSWGDIKAVELDVPQSPLKIFEAFQVNAQYLAPNTFYNISIERNSNPDLVCDIVKSDANGEIQTTTYIYNGYDISKNNGRVVLYLRESWLLFTSSYEVKVGYEKTHHVLTTVSSEPFIPNQPFEVTVNYYNLGDFNEENLHVMFDVDEQVYLDAVYPTLDKGYYLSFHFDLTLEAGTHTLRSSIDPVPDEELVWDNTYEYLISDIVETDSIALVVRGSDNGIFNNIWVDQEGWQGWSKLPGSTPGRPTAATLGTSLHLVVRGSDGGIYHGIVDMETDDFSGWTKFPGGTSTAPSLAATEAGLILTVRGNDDGIYYSTYDGTWSSWSKLPGSTPDAVGTTVVGDTYHVMVRGSDSKMYHGQMTLSTETWLGWTLMTGTTPSQPVLCDDEEYVYLVVRGSDNGIYGSTFDGAWSTWSKNPGSTLQSPGADVSDGELWVCVTGESTGFYYGYTDLESSVWSGWDYLGGSSPSPPTLIGTRIQTETFMMESAMSRFSVTEKEFTTGIITASDIEKMER